MPALVAGRAALVNSIFYASTAAAIAFTTASLFGVLWQSPLPGLTVAEAASGPYTLTVLTWIGLFALPFVLAYQAWTYWVFRRRLIRVGAQIRQP